MTMALFFLHGFGWAIIVDSLGMSDRFWTVFLIIWGWALTFHMLDKFTDRIEASHKSR